MNKNVVAIPTKTTATAITTVAASIALRRGVIYRVVSDTGCWINRDNVAATNADMYLPAGVIDYLVLDQVDISAPATKNISVLGSAAGRIYFTALIPASGAF